jgi:hypothetical protein
MAGNYRRPEPKRAGIMPSKVVYWTSDGGGGSGSGPVAAGLHQWISAQNDAELIIYGGDIYSSGTT